MALRAFTSLLSITLSVLGCAAGGSGVEPEPESPVMQLKRRASSDFDCPREEVRTKTLDDRTKVAEGCGQVGTYIRVCNQRCVDPTSDDCGCTWVLDSARRSSGR